MMNNKKQNKKQLNKVFLQKSNYINVKQLKSNALIEELYGKEDKIDNDNVRINNYRTLLLDKKRINTKWTDNTTNRI